PYDVLFVHDTLRLIPSSALRRHHNPLTSKNKADKALGWAAWRVVVRAACTDRRVQITWSQDRPRTFSGPWPGPWVSRHRDHRGLGILVILRAGHRFSRAQALPEAKDRDQETKRLALRPGLAGLW